MPRNFIAAIEVKVSDIDEVKKLLQAGRDMSILFNRMQRLAKKELPFGHLVNDGVRIAGVFESELTATRCDPAERGDAE